MSGSFPFDRQKFRALVESDGRTLEELSIRLGRSRPTLEAWLSGYRQPNARTVRAVARVFGCRVTDLAADTEGVAP